MLSNYDAWRTREPYWYEHGEPPPPYRCSKCGKFLPQSPSYVRESCAVDWCDGEAYVMEAEHDDAVLAIIGEEFRGRKHLIAYPPVCGSRDGRQENWHKTDHEIDPDTAYEWRHSPHSFQPPWDVIDVNVRVCGCGYLNEEVAF